MAFCAENRDIAVFCFPWTKETSSSQFDASAYIEFLKRYGIASEGLWQREIPSSPMQHVPYGELSTGWNPFVLPSEGVLLEDGLSDMTVCTPANPLRSWSEYYSWRGFRLDSPISILLQWPLTLYHILVNCLPGDYPSAKKLCSDESEFVIHCVGAGKEADLIPAIAELTVLLPTVSFEVHLIGPELSKTVSGQKVMAASRMTVSFHRGLYHTTHCRLPPADVVVGFNDGLVAYTTWIDTIQLLATLKIPSYFTEYCWKSYELTRQQMTVVNKQLLTHCDRTNVPSVTVSEGHVNPFRSPVRIYDSDTDVPRFSNAILFHLVF